MKRLANALPTAVYSAGQVRELDRIAIEERGIPGYELMCRAGHSALAVLRARWPEAHRLAVYCGAGNNAGDGYVLARLAAGDGLTARVVAAVPPERLKGDAQRAWRDCRDAGVPIGGFHDAEAGADSACDVIVDALLGTGLDRALDGAIARAVEHVNASGRPVLSLDIPTGLHADTGLALGGAVCADVTVTFVGLKAGLFLGAAPDYCGAIELADLGLEPSAELRPPLERLTPADLLRALPPRARSAHKGTSGRLLLVGGGPGMPGAIRLAAEAALRAGAGLVYVGTHTSSVASVTATRPEIICRAIERPEEIDALVALADGAVVGPGLGQSAWARALWQRLGRIEQPLVVDADGLNLLAAEPVERERWLLTPHPGEAGRLLAKPSAEVQADRYAAAVDLARRYRAAAVLKGANSLVAVPETSGVSVHVCDHGNPGMATAGMGDVLSGVLGALLVQTRDIARAARAGVLLHALAGDDAARVAQRGTLAADLMPHIRRWSNPT